MGCSLLNHDLSENIHVIPSSTCNCGFHDETVDHFVLSCPNFNTQRNLMSNELQQRGLIWNRDITNILLFGDKESSIEKNKEIFDIFHTYIITTERFKA
jgi:hypothetical protein